MCALDCLADDLGCLSLDVESRLGVGLICLDWAMGFPPKDPWVQLPSNEYYVTHSP